MSNVIGHVFRVERLPTGLCAHLEGGGLLRIDALSAHVLRVRHTPNAVFTESASVRHGYVREELPPSEEGITGGEIELAEDELGVTLTTSGVTARLNRAPARLEILGPGGETLTRTVTPWKTAWGTGSSFGTGPAPATSFQMSTDEHFYGFGFQRDGMDCRGKSLVWARTFRHKSATVPFFLSTRGFGFFSANTWRHVFDFTVQETLDGGYWTVSADGGTTDFYVIHGPGFREILRRYTALTGRPQVPPRYALGLLYICRYFETQPGVLAAAEGFRSHDIPCDMIGLEPGWEQVPYAMKWTWSPERFPDPAEMIRELGRRGYVLEMWESGDAPKTGYADPEVRRAWFRERLATSVDLGAAFYKQDDPYPRMITSQELDTPALGEPLGGSEGGSAAEYANLTNTLYTETLMTEYRAATGRRTFAIFNGYCASVASHRWPAAWAADYQAGTGLLNASLSGHSMACLDMRNSTPAGIHLGFLTPFSIIDAWAYYNEPWLFPPHLLACHRHYAKLRHTLAPYLYSALHQARETGLPMIRPMVLDYPGEPFARDLSTQFGLGDWLLVGLEPTVYLPEGSWVDYATGRVITSRGQWVECAPPEPWGGPLFVRAGAILPMKSVAPSLGAEPADLLILHVWPGDGPTRTTVTEDDGIGFGYERGEIARTVVRAEPAAAGVTVTVQTRAGTYPGMPERRAHLLVLHGPPGSPQGLEVTVDGAPLPLRAGRDALLTRTDEAGVWRDDTSGELWIKPRAGWHFAPDVRGEKDPEKDTLVWAAGARAPQTQMVVHVQASIRAFPVTSTQAPAPTPLEADSLHVAALPPQRIALRHGDWLPHRAVFWVTLMAGEVPARGDDREILLEVRDATGVALHTETRMTTRGRVRFDNLWYQPDDHVFRFTAAGLPARELTIRSQPVVPGGMG